MKIQIKKFGQYIKEDKGFNGDSPQVGDEVYVVGFADDAGVVINCYAGYGKITEVMSHEEYAVVFDSIYDAEGTSDNAPEAIYFRADNILGGGQGQPWAVLMMGLQFQ